MERSEEVNTRGVGVELSDEARGRTDIALNERISRLEARLADQRSSSDSHVNALYSGMRTLVGELIKRRRQAEETCLTLTRVLEATSDGFVALDPDWRYTYVNAHAGQMFGRDAASLLGKKIWDEFPEGVGQPFHKEYELAIRDGTPRSFESYYEPFGRWFENRVYPYAGGLAIFFQDVTEQRLARERLNESEQRYRSLFDHNPDGVYSFDADGRLVSANTACETLTGYPIDELIGGRVGALAAPEDQERALGAFRAVMDGAKRRFDSAVVHKSGRRVPVSITELPIVINEKVVGAYGIAKDLTAQHELESRLKQAEKMQAIGRVASGIAHDFNNLLTIIQSCAGFLDRDLPPHGTYLSDVEEIQNAARRAAQLTQQLLAFGRKQVLQPQLLDVNRQMTTFAATLRRVIGAEIVVETVLAPDAWPVFADPGQFDRVLMNLGLNARDAMPNGGTLRLGTANVSIDDTTNGGHPPLSSGGYVLLSVEDTGTGIDPEVRARIFEPFVTTKAPGVGTGLGLATAYGIVEQSGGIIHVESELGRGTRFTIYLPRATRNHGTA